MYDSGTASGGALIATGLAITGGAVGQWWIIAAAVGFLALGLVFIRFSSRKAVTRVKLSSWEELDKSPGVDPDGWD